MSDEFVPDSYVPISVTINHTGENAIECLNVNRLLLLALKEKGHRIYAAWSDAGRICYTDEVTVDYEQGEVSFRSFGRGPCAIIAETMVNVYPVTTNWSSDLNGGRGGVQPGAAGELGRIHWNASEGQRTVQGHFRNTDDSHPFYFNSEEYALWDNEDPAAQTPAYERYIGETYSLYGVSEAAALQLSAEALQHCGFPVLIRRSDTLAAELENVPAFQLVHNVIIGRSKHRSLATFVLPPFWRRAAESYPALFSGFYDQNENVFSTVGPEMLKVLGQLFNEQDTGVVGIIWNGGGSIGSRTLQQSIYANLDDLFMKAKSVYGVREDGIVAAGGSRGGFASLLAAANPNQDCYRIRYAVCHNVPFLLGTPLLTMLNSSHSILDQALCEDTGYKDAWRKSWRNEQGQSGMELFLETVLGTSDIAEIDALRSPSSEAVMRRIAANGTEVLQNHGTHDPFTASWLTYRWVDRARSLGIRVRHEIGYRFGHNNCVPPFESAKRCLESILKDEPLMMNGNFHYVRASSDPADWSRAEQLEVKRQPVFLEAPKVVIRGLANDYILYGVPGMDYRLVLEAAQQDDDKERFVLMEGRLQQISGMRSDFSYAAIYRKLDELRGELYRYRLYYRLPGDDEWTVDLPYTPQPDHPDPTLKIMKEQPNPLQPDWLQMTLQHFIGWGLSEI